MSRICLFPGTFDPVTLGHTDIVNRSINLFDKIYIGIGKNANKQPMFSDEQRLEWLTEIYKDEPRVEAHYLRRIYSRMLPKAWALPIS